MSFVVLADVHAHNFAQFAQPVAYYGNTRLQVIAKALARACIVALQKELPLIIVGDLFHTRGIINVTVQSIIHDTLREYANKGLEIHIVAGNHDQANKAGTVTSLDTFKAVAHVYTDYACLGAWAFVPFRESREELIEMFNQAAKSKVQYVFAHAAVNGAYIGDSEYQPREQLEVADIKPERFKWVWLGHYHKAQLVAPNAMYCGSLTGQNFTDSDEKGFWVHEGNKEPVFHPSGSPRFIQATVQNATDLKRFSKIVQDTNDYYKLKVIEGLKLPDFKGNVLVEKLASSKVFESRIQGMDTMTDPEVIEAYVRSKSPDQAKSLISKGVDILNSSK